ncbi:hypothetical protein [Yersinia massiliensis]|uniref:hypothetical protein n=1 Tax=Yersinia massiliensis TaxID=419257 RepID=UPI000B1ADD87|nr:hypothetical protein [Yersinia massiliensis]
MPLQLGSKGAHPDELTSVSDSGKRAQLTTLRRQEEWILPKVIAVAARQQGSASR